MSSAFLTPTQLAAIATPAMSRWGITPGLGDQIVCPTQGDDNTTPGAVKAANSDILIFGNKLAGSSVTISSLRSINSGGAFGSPVTVCVPSGSNSLCFVNVGPFKRSNGQILLPVIVGPASGDQHVEIWSSTDNGTNWTLLSTIGALGYTHGTQSYGAIIEPSISGTPTLLMPAYGLTSDPNITDAILLQSTDSGVTWTLRSVIATNDATHYWSETSVIQVSGNNYLAVFRDDFADATNGVLYSATSSDAGVTWSSPSSALFDGVSPALISSPSSGILLFSTHRNTSVSAPTTTRGVVARRTTNGGTTWGSPVQLTFDAKNTAFQGYPCPIVLTGTTIGMAYRNPSGFLAWNQFDDSLI